MEFPIKELEKYHFPANLTEIPKPPEKLNYRGELPPPGMKLLSVVGSRRYTNYGKQAVDYLIGGLAGYDIGIVSGLALGIDSLAHQAALDNSLYTLSIPGSGLSDKVIYPASHKRLALDILKAGGGLLSEFEPDFRATTWSFPQRNRLVCGISPATLVIEANEKSGTLITARLCADYNRELLVVPGNIFSDNSKGVHQFLKIGATPITSPEDILDVLGIEIRSGPELSKKAKLTPEESRVIDILNEPIERDSLIRRLDMPVSAAAIILMQMEMAGRIKEENGVYRKL